jgi:hypothetical protein
MFENVDDKHRKTVTLAVTRAATELLAANIDAIAAGDF